MVIQKGRAMISTRRFLHPALIISAFLLAGCRVAVDTIVNKDGSGELRTSIIFSAEEKQNFENSPQNSGKNICDHLKADSPPDTAFFEEARGDETYCTTLRSFGTLKQLRSLYQGMANVTVNELRLGIGVFTYDVQVDLTPQNGNEAAPHEWRLTVPGTVRANNADLIENNTLIWNIEPGEIRNLKAESEVGPHLLIQGLVGGLIVLFGIIFAVWLARRVARRNEQNFVSVQTIIYPPTR